MELYIYAYSWSSCHQIYLLKKKFISQTIHSVYHHHSKQIIIICIKRVVCRIQNRFADSRFCRKRRPNGFDYNFLIRTTAFCVVPQRSTNLVFVLDSRQKKNFILSSRISVSCTRGHRINFVVEKCSWASNRIAFNGKSYLRSNVSASPAF